jgi:predicted transcriptional regulator
MLIFRDHNGGGKNMRSKTKANDQIVSKILKTCANGASETRITHKSGPNSMKVISYLLLIDEGFIEVVTEGSRIVHRATPRGMDRIKKFERLLGNEDKLIVKPEICLQSSC